MKFFIKSIALVLAAVLSMKVAAAGERIYNISLNIVPPAGAEQVEKENEGHIYKVWTLDGEEIRAMWMYAYTDMENSDESMDYLMAMPLDYGYADWSTDPMFAQYLQLAEENFPIIIQRMLPQSEDPYEEPQMMGGVLVNGVYHKFDESGRVTITEPNDYTLIGYEIDREEGSVKISADCDFEYSIGDGERISVTEAESPVTLSVYPATVVKVYPVEGTTFSNVVFKDPAKPSDSYRIGNQGGCYTVTLPDANEFTSDSPYTITIEREKISINIVCSIENAISKRNLDVKGGKYTAVKGNVHTFSVPKSDKIQLSISPVPTYRIKDVYDNAGVKTVRFDSKSYTVSGIESDMTLYVDMEKIVDDKSIYVGFYDYTPIKNYVSPIFNKGTAREWKQSFDPKSSAVTKMKYSSYDETIQINGARFESNGKEYVAALYLNNERVEFNEEKDIYVLPDVLPDNSVLRFVSSSGLGINVTMPLTMSVEKGIEIDFLVDYVKRDIPYTKANYPTGCYFIINAAENNPYEFVTRYTSKSSSGVMQDNVLRMLTGHSNLSIYVEKANKRNLMVYVEEMSEGKPFTHVNLSPGKSHETAIELDKGYQQVTLAKEDLPLGLTTADGVTAAVYLNGELLEKNEAGYVFPADLPAYSVLKIFEAREEGIKTARVSYNFASLTDYDIALTHDNVGAEVDPEAVHQLLPGTEIRFTISPKENVTPTSATIKMRKADALEDEAPYTVAVNGEELQPDANGEYMVKVNDDHIANGLNINVTKAGEEENPDVPTGIDEIMADGLRVDVYNVAGVQVKKNADAASLRQLPSGVYVIDGKKVLIGK